MKERTRFPVLQQALDEARFGAARTLNLRASLPTPAQAVSRAESWLREKQVSRAGEVLVITGRGNQSAEGVSVVREAIVKLLARLRRLGVVASVAEHTAGSFVVQLAPIRALREAPRRRRHPRDEPAVDPAALSQLAPETRRLLRELAQRALDELGVKRAHEYLEREMLAQFSYVAGAVPEGADREARLRAALAAALREYEDR